MAADFATGYVLQPGEAFRKMTLRGHLLLLLCLGFVFGPMPESLARPQRSRAKQIESIAREPMIFFVAKGGPNACGPGCSQWIAAQGNFDEKSEDRFRTLLAS